MNNCETCVSLIEHALNAFPDKLGTVICEKCMKDYGIVPFFEHDERFYMCWTKVEDWLPQNEKRALVSYSKGVCVAKLIAGQWHCDAIGSYGSDGCIFGVTHWMPLPLPPVILMGTDNGLD